MTASSNVKKKIRKSPQNKDRRIQHQIRLIAELQSQLELLKQKHIRLITDYDALQLEVRTQNDAEDCRVLAATERIWANLNGLHAIFHVVGVMSKKSDAEIRRDILHVVEANWPELKGIKSHE